MGCDYGLALVSLLFSLNRAKRQAQLLLFRISRTYVPSRKVRAARIGLQPSAGWPLQLLMKFATPWRRCVAPFKCCELTWPGNLRKRNSWRLSYANRID